MNNKVLAALAALRRHGTWTSENAAVSYSNTSDDFLEAPPKGVAEFVDPPPQDTEIERIAECSLEYFRELSRPDISGEDSGSPGDLEQSGI